MPYTQEATIKTHYRKLRNFIKLIDYMLLDSKLNLARNGTNSLLEVILGMNRMNDIELKPFGHVCWIRIDVVIQN